MRRSNTKKKYAQRTQTNVFFFVIKLSISHECLQRLMEVLIFGCFGIISPACSHSPRNIAQTHNRTPSRPDEQKYIMHIVIFFFFLVSFCFIRVWCYFHSVGCSVFISIIDLWQCLMCYFKMRKNKKRGCC